MTNPNPFVPKGSLLEQQSQRRSRLKLAVFCVLAVCVTGLTAMLIQGCKREKPDTDLNPPPFEISTNPPIDTNPVPNVVSNPPPYLLPPAITNLQPVDVAVPTSGSTHVIVKGDTLAKIAKKYGVTLKALQAANPKVVTTKLKLGSTLTIPADGTMSVGVPVSNTASSDMGGTTYTVKSADTLTKIARDHGVTIKAIQAANNLTTTKIKVGDKLKIPAKAVAAAPVAPMPPVDTTPAPPALPPLSPAPVPGH